MHRINVPSSLQNLLLLVVTKTTGFCWKKTGVHEMAKNCPSVRIWAKPLSKFKITDGSAWIWLSSFLKVDLELIIKTLKATNSGPNVLSGKCEDFRQSDNGQSMIFWICGKTSPSSSRSGPRLGVDPIPSRLPARRYEIAYKFCILPNICEIHDWWKVVPQFGIAKLVRS